MLQEVMCLGMYSNCRERWSETSDTTDQTICTKLESELGFH